MASSSSAIIKGTVAKGNTDKPQGNPASTQQIEDFVAEPNVLDRQAPSWYNHVLIPSEKPFTHAFLGPLPDPLESEEIKEVFPSHQKLQPRIFDDETPFHLEYLKNPTRVFRSAPRVEQDDYKAWLDKVQAKKEEVWKEQGIFDIIQLSRYGPKYNSTLILAALQFWDIISHSLQLKCGMLSLTLLDVAAITGLKPLGETFDPKLPVNNTFNFDTAAFAPYIQEHHKTDTVEVSDFEHIAFLTLWLSIFVFRSRSIQVSKTYIPLEIQLHEGNNINLAKLILGTTYQHLDGAAAELKESDSTTKLLIAGPMWLFQLWLIATFETRLGLFIPKEIRPSMPSRRTEGIRLAQLKSKQKELTSEGSFSAYFEIFLNCNAFTESMAPFVNCTYGPDWFKRKFLSPSPEHVEETNQIWQAYLSPAILSTRLTPSANKNNLGIRRYFPSYFSRQFGLCQLRPAPAYLHRRELNSPKTEQEFKLVFKKFQYKDLHFEPINFNV